MRAIAFIIALTTGLGLGVLAVVIGSPVYSYFIGMLAGAVCVLANVLTNPLLFGWRD